MYYKDDIRKSCNYKELNKQTYTEIKGYTHNWTNFITSEGSFIASKYTKYIKNGLYWVNIRNSSEGWVLHLFYGGSKFKSWFKTLDNLNECLEYAELFLNNKLEMDSF